MRKIALILILLIFPFSTLLNDSMVSANTKTPEQLVIQAEGYAKKLSTHISYEKTKNLKLVSSSLIKSTNDSLVKARAAVKNVKNEPARKKLQVRLGDVQSIYNRTLLYNDSVRTGISLEKNKNALLATYEKSPASNQTEKYYQAVKKDLHKLKSAIKLVHGKPTRTAMIGKYQTPAEKALSKTKTAYQLKSELNLLRKYMHVGDKKTIFSQVDKVNSQLDKMKSNRKLYQSFSYAYDNVLRENGVTSDGMPTIILKKVIAQEKSVVYLEVYDKDNNPISQGSGFIVGKGTILTNYHVVEGGNKIVAYNYKGSKISVRGVVKYNEVTDLALLGTSKDLTLPALKMGDTTYLEKGDPVVTIGSPEGLMNTVSTGIISNLHQLKDDGGSIIKLIQFTAPITYGSSGGALFNMHGEVIGVTSSGFDNGNLNFALSISHASKWIKDYGSKAASTLPIIPYSSLPTLPVEPGTDLPIEETGPIQQQPVPISTDKLTLDFNARDVVIHPNKPILYALSEQKDLVEINLLTKQAKKITFALPPERLYFANNELYITLLKGQHSPYWRTEDQQGAFAIVDAESFTLIEMVDIPLDPYDIVADSKHIYISSGSGQWTSLKAFSRKTLLETATKSSFNHASFLEMHPTSEGKVYSITTQSSPRDVHTHLFTDGKHTSSYDSPYHGDYPLNVNMSISPDGKYIFNGSGVVLQTASTREFDMKYVTKLYNTYEEIAFNLSTQRLYTSSNKNLIVYDYSTLERIKHYELNHGIDFMFVQDHELIVLYKETAPGTLLPKQVVKKYPLTQQGLLTF